MSSENQALPTIRVQNLSKLYYLHSHQGSLRDTLSYRLKNWRRKGGATEKKTLWALKDVIFEVNKGEALGILGPNGAGKTTILKLLSRVTFPTSGTIEVNGRLGALLELGAGFHPELTGRENTYLYGSILGMSRQQISQKFDDIVAFSGLERFIDMPVKRYSSGMYVRLGFSVAAHTDPEVLLVDEVLAVGDAEFRQKCIQRIKSLQEQGVSIIFISHNLFQMRAVCDRGIFLNQGQIQAQGTIDEAIAAYEQWLRQGNRILDSKKPYEFISGQGGTDLQLLGIEVCNLDGQPSEVLDYSDGADIRLHYYAQRDFPQVNYVVRIVRSDGLVCAMLRSSSLGLPSCSLQGQGYISIRLNQLQLGDGDYLIEARLRDSEDAVTLAKGSSAAFRVCGPRLAGDRESGVFIPNIAGVSVVNQLQPAADHASTQGGHSIEL